MRRLIGLLIGVSVALSAMGSTAVAPAKMPKRRAQEPAVSSSAVSGQSLTLLPNGSLLILGGDTSEGPVSTAVIKNPQTGQVQTLVNGLHHARYGHTATLLPNGSVFIFGGWTSGGVIETIAELFDPATQQFRDLPSTGLLARAGHTATLLTDGRVIIAGGIVNSGATTGSIAVWNFETNTATALPPGLIAPRSGHSATLLADGTVLFWGGLDSTGSAVNFGEIFDPVTNRTTVTTTPQAATTLPPQLAASLPQDQSTNVPPNTLIALRFSKPMNVATVNAQTVTLTDAEGSVQTSVVPAEGGMLAFVAPTSLLEQGTKFTLTIAGASDPSGESLASSSVSFTTSGGNDSSADADIPVGSSDGDMWVPNTDNFKNSWTSGQASSPWQKLPALQAAPGVTALAGQALRLSGVPLAGVTLQIGSASVTTDDTGRFLLTNIPAGHQVLLVNGTTASQQGRTYGIFQVGVDLVASQTTALRYTIWMTRLDMAHAVTIPSPTTKDMVISTPLLPGLELHLPAGTVIRDRNGNAVTQISITPVPIDQPPFPLPSGFATQIYFTIQPGDAYIDVSGSWKHGAQLYYPNQKNAAPGTRFQFWNYDPTQKGWYVYGMGTVSADGSQIVPDPGVEIYEFTGAMDGGSSQGAPTGSNAAGGSHGGDPIDLGTGLFNYNKTDLYLPDVIPIDLARYYRPNDSTSRGFGIGTNNSYDIAMLGPNFPYSYADIVMPNGSRIECPNNSSDPNKSYATALFQCGSVPGPFYGAVGLWNGNGWNFTLRDGTVYQFPDGFLQPRAEQSSIIAIIDRNGNKLSITRDSNGNITRLTSPNGRWIQLTYDSNNRATEAQDNLGRTVQYSYDPSGRLTKVIDANGGSWLYAYDSNNEMKTITDARGIVYLQNQYDGNYRVTKQILADGTSNYQFSYNPGCVSNCSVITETDVTDPNGNVKKVTFNAPPTFSSGFTTGGLPSAVTLAYGTAQAQTFSYTYQSGTNLLTSVTDPLSRVTSYTYDSQGNLASVTRLYGTSGAVTTSFTYDATFSQLASVTDPLSHTTSLGHDSRGNLVSLTDPVGNVSTFSVNSEGQLVSAADPLGKTTTFAYDGADLTTITDPLSRSTTLFSDAAGRLMSRADALGNRTKYRYNAFNEVTGITDPLGQSTSLTYDANGNLLSVTDANSHAVSTYSYDSFDRVSTRQDALGRSESYQYDPLNNLTQFTDRRGKVSIYSYDDLNRLNVTDFGVSGGSHESEISYTFDAGNRLTQVVDSVAGTIAHGYDGLDRLTSESTPQGSVGYSYDAAGRRTGMTVTGQSAVGYSYDADNRLVQITQGTSTVGVAYDIASRRTSLTLPNGVVMSYSYDDASQLTAINYTHSSTTLGNLTFAYDLAGRRTSMGGTYASTGLPNAISTTGYDNANELTTWGTSTPTYDANGNILSDGTNSYMWNARNQLVSMNSSAESFAYDPFGRRVSKSILGSTINYLYDGLNPVQELAGTTPTANLLTGGIDEYFTRTTSAGTADYLTDALGSTLALTDSSADMLAQYTYEPFGNTSNIGAGGNPYQYTGRENDGTGIYFYRNRYYSPTLQRFISPDPVGVKGGINLYAYVGNNPAGARDPLGLWQFTVGGGWGYGGIFTIGENGGQWSVGFYGGYGAGGFASYDPIDSGAGTAGFAGGLSGSADFGVELPGGLGVGGDATVGQDGATGDVTIGTPVSGGITIPLPPSSIPPHGTFGAGLGGAFGIGGTVRFSGRK